MILSNSEKNISYNKKLTLYTTKPMRGIFMISVRLVLCVNSTITSYLVASSSDGVPNVTRYPKLPVKKRYTYIY